MHAIVVLVGFLAVSSAIPTPHHPHLYKRHHLRRYGALGRDAGASGELAVSSESSSSFQTQSGYAHQSDFGIGAAGGAQQQYGGEAAIGGGHQLQGGHGLTIQKTLVIGGDGRHAAKVAGVADAVGQAIGGVASSVSQAIGHVSNPSTVGGAAGGSSFDASWKSNVNHQQQHSYGGAYGGNAGLGIGGGAASTDAGGKILVQKQFSHDAGAGVAGVASIIGNVVGNVAKSVTDSVGHVAHSVGNSRKVIAHGGSTSVGTGFYHSGPVAAPPVKQYETVYAPAPLVPAPVHSVPSVAPASHVQSVAGKTHSVSHAQAGSFHAENNFHVQSSAGGGAVAAHHSVPQVQVTVPVAIESGANVGVAHHHQAGLATHTDAALLPAHIPPPAPHFGGGGLHIQKDISFGFGGNNAFNAGTAAGGDLSAQKQHGFQSTYQSNAESNFNGGAGYQGQAGGNYGGYAHQQNVAGVADIVGGVIGNVAQSVADSVQHVSQSVAASKAHLHANAQHSNDALAAGHGGLSIQKSLVIQHTK